MDVDSIKILAYNPYFCNNLIPYFLKGISKQKCDIILLHLLLPIVLHKESREKLNNANSRSSIYSIFSDEISAGIESRVDDFKKLTNQSLILAINKNYAKIDGEQIKLMNVINFDFSKEKDSYIRPFYKASFKFGELISGHKTLDVLLKFRIREL